jgi:hypothetical protein
MLCDQLSAEMSLLDKLETRGISERVCELLHDRLLIYVHCSSNASASVDRKM